MGLYVCFLFFLACLFNELGETVTSPGLECMAICQHIVCVIVCVDGFGRPPGSGMSIAWEGPRACCTGAELAGWLDLGWVWAGGILGCTMPGLLGGATRVGVGVGRGPRDAALWPPWVPAGAGVG